MHKAYTKLRKNIKHFSGDYVEDEKRNCIGYEFHAMRCVYQTANKEFIRKTNRLFDNQSHDSH